MNINKTIAAALAAGAYMLAMPFQSFAARTVSGSYTLSSDEDWTADGVVTLDGATIDLAGYTLKMQSVTGSGAIVSTETPFVDLTTDDASKVVAEGDACHANYPASKAFNNVMDKTSMAYVVGGLQTYTAIGWDFGAATSVNCYRIYPGMNSNVAAGWPKDWTFEGSDDGGTWSVLDKRADEEFIVATWNTYRLDATATYRYFRVKFTAQQVMTQSNDDRFNVDELEFGFTPVSRLQLDAAAAVDSDFSNITLGEDVNLALDLSAASGKLAVSSVAGVASGAFQLVGGKLAADVDLAGLGKTTLAGDIDLAGHILKVDAIDGEGRFTTSETGDFVNYIDTSDAASRISATSNGGAATIAANYPLSYAVDGSETSFCIPQSSPVEIIYDFGSGKVVNCYRICLYTSGTLAYPTAWTFEGSNDNLTWTALDTQSGATFSKSIWQDFGFENADAYRYYRWNVTASTASSKNYINGIGELQYGRIPANKVYVSKTGVAASDMTGIEIASGVEVYAGDGDGLVLDSNLDMTGFPVSGTIDLNGYALTLDSLAGGGTITDTSAATGFADLTTTNGLSAANKFIWASTNGVEVALAGTGGNGLDGSKYPAERAFDNVWGDTKIPLTAGGEQNYSFLYYATKAAFWTGGNTFELNYRFDTPTLVERYRIYAGSSASNAGYPTAWTFEGSTDGETWKTLDTQSGQSLAQANWYDFDTVNTIAYQYYRLKISATAVATRIDIGEVEFGCRHTPGRLVVNVPAGKTVENTDVAIEGNVRLVKDGAGTLVASKSGQTYMGGTEVSEGTLEQGTAGAGLFGPDGAEIKVAADGVFDTAGRKTGGSVGKYLFKLAGGAIASSTAAAAGSNYESVRDVVLSADSSFDSSASLYVGSSAYPGTIDIGGNTLSATIGNGQYLRLDSGVMTNGTFSVAGTGSGTLIVRGANGVDARTVDVKLNCPLLLANNSSFSVRGYESLWTGDNGAQTGTLYVYGAFKPTTDYWYGCTLADGATLDLSTRTGALNAVSSAAGNQTALAFEENAVVNVVLGDKRFAGGKILSWTSETKPANIDTVKFVRADADRPYALTLKSDGLYAQAGLIISFH